MTKNVSKKKKRRNDWLTRKNWVFGKTSLHANTKEEKTGGANRTPAVNI